MKQAMYVAIREADGREWMDTSSLHLVRELTVKTAAEQDARIPQWAAANPVKRIVPVTVTPAEGEFLAS